MLPAGQIQKYCGCGRTHDATAWASLPYVCEQYTDDDAATYRTEMRNCGCGSTIAVEHAESWASLSVKRALALIRALRDDLTASDDNAAVMAHLLAQADAAVAELERSQVELKKVQS